MPKVAVALVLLMIPSLLLRAQTTRISFTLRDEAGTPVTDCNIKITGVTSSLIYSYFNVSNTSVVKKEFNTIKADDSLNVFISNITYKDTTIRFAAGKETNRGIIKLQLQNHVLKDILIKGPSVWKQGDTTNFRADAFKQGDEKKLKDIIRNMPYLSIDDNGRLTFRGQPVSRILIDGQELFADQTKLLLNNFPAKVVELLQIQENQNANKMLKGIGGSDIVMNLTLKKGTFLPAFGDVEAGAGDKGQYTASPVLFSLSKNVKAGYIGNINSVGKGLNWNTASEIQSPLESEAGSLMVRNAGLNLVQNLPESYYLKNRLFDNRFDVTARLSPKLNVKTTVSVITDRQSQETFNRDNYFTGSTYATRLDHNSSVYEPMLIRIGQTYDYTINATNNLEAKVWWFADYDHSKGSTSSTYGHDSTSYISNRLKNNWNSFNLQAQYTHLNKNKQAEVTSVEYNRQYISQNINSFSPQWAQIFQLSDPAYTGLFQNPDYHYSVLNLTHTRYFQIKEQKVNVNFSFKNEEMSLAPTLSLSDTTHTLPSVSPAGFNSSGQYGRNAVSASLNGSIKTKGAQNTILDYRVSLGVNRTGINSDTLKKTITLPQLDAFIMFKLKPISGYSHDISLTYDEFAPDFTKIYNIFLPESPSSYIQYTIPGKAYRELFLNYNAAINWKDDLSSTNFYLGLIHNFNNAVYETGYQYFFNLNTVSLVNRTTNNIYLTINNKVPSLWLNALLELDARVAYFPQLFTYQGQVLQSKNTQASLKLSLKKNWNQKYFIALSGLYNYTDNRRPRLDTTAAVNNRLDNFIAGFKQRLLITNSLSLISNTQLVYNNLTSPNGTRFLLQDAELGWKLKKNPLELTLRAENLVNQKTYVVAYNGGTSQSRNTIPLIGRSFFITARYEF
jgi:hypothetical protein